MATSLKDFVAGTLEEIVSGVDEAQSRICDEYPSAHINPVSPSLGAKIVSVEFDVAVTVAETKKHGGGAGISVVGIGGGGAHMATEREFSNVSRIKFSVPGVLPTESKAPDV